MFTKWVEGLTSIDEIVLWFWIIIGIYDLVVVMLRLNRLTFSEWAQTWMPSWADLIVFLVIFFGIIFKFQMDRVIELLTIGMCGHILLANRERYKKRRII